MKRIGLLGCGSIGSKIAIAIDTGKIPAQLTHIYDEDKKKSNLECTMMTQSEVSNEGMENLSHKEQSQTEL